MPLEHPEQEEAEYLLVTARFGAESERKEAHAALQEWAQGSAERQRWLRKAEQAERALDPTMPFLRERYARHVPRPQGNAATVRALFLRRYRIPLIVAACACAAFSILWGIDPVLSQQNLSSAIGQQLDIDLGDGSHVRLNTDTAAVFANRFRSREITLERGEALFYVKHNVLRPFNVLAGAAHITDIGTRFSVRLFDPGVSVAVLDGNVSVSLSAKADALLLNRNQAVIVDGVQVRSYPDAKAFAAMTTWPEGRLNFDQTALPDVATELQRYRRGPIHLVGKRMNGIRITGSFSSHDPDQLLRTLPQVAPVKVELHPDGTAIITSLK